MERWYVLLIESIFELPILSNCLSLFLYKTKNFQRSDDVTNNTEVQWLLHNLILS